MLINEFCLQLDALSGCAKMNVTTKRLHSRNTAAIPSRIRDTRCDDAPETRQGEENQTCLGLFLEQN